MHGLEATGKKLRSHSLLIVIVPAARQHMKRQNTDLILQEAMMQSSGVHLRVRLPGGRTCPCQSGWWYGTASGSLLRCPESRPGCAWPQESAAATPSSPPAQVHHHPPVFPCNTLPAHACWHVKRWVAGQLVWCVALDRGCCIAEARLNLAARLSV